MIAQGKADKLLPSLKEHKETVLVTCDQVVLFEGEVREKPESEEEARLFLEGYRGSHASTVSAVIATNTETGKRGEHSSFII
jgi:septum formation protein